MAEDESSTDGRDGVCPASPLNIYHHANEEVVPISKSVSCQAFLDNLSLEKDKEVLLDTMLIGLEKNCNIASIRDFCAAQQGKCNNTTSCNKEITHAMLRQEFMRRMQREYCKRYQWKSPSLASKSETFYRSWLAECPIKNEEDIRHLESIIIQKKKAREQQYEGKKVSVPHQNTKLAENNKLDDRENMKRFSAEKEVTKYSLEDGVTKLSSEQEQETNHSSSAENETNPCSEGVEDTNQSSEDVEATRHSPEEEEGKGIELVVKGPTVLSPREAIFTTFARAMASIMSESDFLKSKKIVLNSNMTMSCRVLLDLMMSKESHSLRNSLLKCMSIGLKIPYSLPLPWWCLRHEKPSIDMYRLEMARRLLREFTPLQLACVYHPGLFTPQHPEHYHSWLHRYPIMNIEDIPFLVVTVNSMRQQEEKAQQSASILYGSEVNHAGEKAVSKEQIIMPRHDQQQSYYTSTTQGMQPCLAEGRVIQKEPTGTQNSASTTQMLQSCLARGPTHKDQANMPKKQQQKKETAEATTNGAHSSPAKHGAANESELVTAQCKLKQGESIRETILRTLAQALGSILLENGFTQRIVLNSTMVFSCKTLLDLVEPIQWFRLRTAFLKCMLIGLEPLSSFSPLFKRAKLSIQMYRLEMARRLLHEFPLATSLQVYHSGLLVSQNAMFFHHWLQMNPICNRRDKAFLTSTVHLKYHFEPVANRRRENRSSKSKQQKQQSSRPPLDVGQVCPTEEETAQRTTILSKQQQQLAKSTTNGLPSHPAKQAFTRQGATLSPGQDQDSRMNERELSPAKDGISQQEHDRHTLKQQHMKCTMNGVNLCPTEAALSQKEPRIVLSKQMQKGDKVVMKTGLTEKETIFCTFSNALGAVLGAFGLAFCSISLVSTTTLSCDILLGALPKETPTDLKASILKCMKIGLDTVVPSQPSLSLTKDLYRLEMARRVHREFDRMESWVTNLLTVNSSLFASRDVSDYRKWLQSNPIRDARDLSFLRRTICLVKQKQHHHHQSSTDTTTDGQLAHITDAEGELAQRQDDQHGSIAYSVSDDTTRLRQLARDEPQNVQMASLHCKGSLSQQSQYGLATTFLDGKETALKVADASLAQKQHISVPDVEEDPNEIGDEKANPSQIVENNSGPNEDVAALGRCETIPNSTDALQFSSDKADGVRVDPVSKIDYVRKTSGFRSGLENKEMWPLSKVRTPPGLANRIPGRKSELQEALAEIAADGTDKGGRTISSNTAPVHETFTPEAEAHLRKRKWNNTGLSCPSSKRAKSGEKRADTIQEGKCLISESPNVSKLESKQEDLCCSQGKPPSWSQLNILNKRKSEVLYSQEPSQKAQKSRPRTTEFPQNEKNSECTIHASIIVLEKKVEYPEGKTPREVPLETDDDTSELGWDMQQPPSPNRTTFSSKVDSTRERMDCMLASATSSVLESQKSPYQGRYDTCLDGQKLSGGVTPAQASQGRLETARSGPDGAVTGTWGKGEEKNNERLSRGENNARATKASCGGTRSVADRAQDDGADSRQLALRLHSSDRKCSVAQEGPSIRTSEEPLVILGDTSNANDITKLDASTQATDSSAISHVLEELINAKDASKHDRSTQTSKRPDETTQLKQLTSFAKSSNVVTQDKSTQIENSAVSQLLQGAQEIGQMSRQNHDYATKRAAKEGSVASQEASIRDLQDALAAEKAKVETQYGTITMLLCFSGLFFLLAVFFFFACIVGAS